ncbi:hydroxyurea phosphotransferase [Actinocatenispora thailandica]|uniref:Hydroxyurea phosphotransferase n=1 Tax=Actinocatenispora thailandica TaxID=227318 RepID=A0A7R7I1C5_9ACTN|nr:aminoglycoside phosphotransferase family protein [Actinocatenispora thailandica]BCJ38918.1 hydroxyurea phosphotransferase [Actinocatenispora thailandica]
MLEHELPAGMADFIGTEFGPRGRRWLDDLPALVDTTCRRFGVRITGPVLPGGTHSYVVPVRGDGRELVLKVPVLDEENFAECAALRCYAGDGAVRLYDVDLDSGALLLERADPGTPLLTEYERGALSLDEVVDVAAGLLRRLRRVPAGDLSHPAPQSDGPAAATVAEPFPLVRDLALRWARELPEAYRRFTDAPPPSPAGAAPSAGGARPTAPRGAGGPLPKPLFDEASELCVGFAEPDGAEVLVNRDAHTGNVLSGRGGTAWLLIDPKPVVGDAAFDAGHLVWDLLRYEPVPARAARLVDRVAAGLAVDRARVRGWALIRAVQNLTWAVPAGEAAPYLAGAAALAAS